MKKYNFKINYALGGFELYKLRSIKAVKATVFEEGDSVIPIKK
jgi:hypothetical protein